MSKTVLAKHGRFALLVEPRDAWVGVFVGPDAVYICPIPFLAVRVHRHDWRPFERLGDVVTSRCPCGREKTRIDSNGAS